ncbi:Retrovirus-related Pol polyprotein from transposon RE2 [Sesamum angolense]|uniref:Retrovirus-related Pol polyprotein from transposon RE2 n=1 Tax=Sesamum angolense TaxID=2727404 RepID=A0AAE2C3K4_9LAMI|nr:Retrovirus-related Pol polyprotein from transposon RE2 [Sesamum angolense]
MQCSWKEVFQQILDAMNCSLRNQSATTPERYGFLGVTGQLDNDPKTYGEAMSDIDSGKWLEAMKSKMDSMSSNQVWTLVDQPKGVRLVGCKWVYKRKIRADGEMDVKTAFLNDFIEEEIYMDQPEGFTVVGEEQKSYGAMISLKTTLTLVYTRWDTEAWLSTQFSMKDLGEASYILGINIFRDRSIRILGMTQNSYVEKVLKRFKMKHFKRGFLSMRHGVKLSKKQSPKTDDEIKRMLDIPYASAVGSIQYAAQCTRLDIAYAFSVTSRYQACAGEAHWTAVKIILKYLRRTKDVFLVYGGGELILEGFSDASFQSNDDDAKSQSGFVFKLKGGVMAWKSSKQDTTTDSTTEAEYIAAKEAVWMKNYIQELGVVPSIVEPVVIFCDNNGATVQAKEPRSHHRSKYILRRYHLFREMVGRGDVRTDRVSSAENIADPLTKPVSQIAHAQHLGKMGLTQMNNWV